MKSKKKRKHQSSGTEREERKEEMLNCKMKIIMIIITF